MPFLFLDTSCITSLYYAYLMSIQLTKHQILMQIEEIQHLTLLPISDDLRTKNTALRFPFRS